MFALAVPTVVFEDGAGVTCSSFREDSSSESIDSVVVGGVGDGHIISAFSSFHDGASSPESEQIRDLAWASSSLRVLMMSCASPSWSAQLAVPVNKEFLCMPTSREQGFTTFRDTSCADPSAEGKACAV